MILIQYVMLQNIKFENIIHISYKFSMYDCLCLLINNFKIYFYFAVMIPFWIIFLGKRIFTMGEMPVPYSRIGFSIIALIIPLCIGYGIQRFMPRVSRVMTRILKPLSSFLIIFIIIFATVTNLYLFKIFSWKVSI